MEDRQSRVLIVGAGLAGSLAVQSISSSGKGPVIIGFIDDDRNKLNLKVCGLPVLGNRFDIPRIADRHKVNEIVIALPSAPPDAVSDIVRICKGLSGVKIKILPGTYDLKTGCLNPISIREVQLEDLLGRKPLSLDLNSINNYLKDQVVLVTGAGGSVGTELSMNIANSNPGQLVLMGRGENSIYEVERKLTMNCSGVDIATEIADIRDRGRITRLFQKYKPGVVFHAAAHKHVPYMERIPEEAVKNNILGTKVMCEVAHEFNCDKFVLISTDKAVKPTSIMGVTKRIAEAIVLMMNRESQTKFSAVRFGNILGSRGSVIPLFEKQIARGGPVTITHPQMMRYFMTVSEAAWLVIQAGAIARGGEVFVLDMGEPVCIKDLAYKLIKLKGLEPEKEIAIEYTGIRPGEKITEVLVGDDEQVKTTPHKKIFAVYSSVDNFARVKELLATLEKPGFSYAEEDIRSLLRPYLG
ncbi:polysaccharide biosynthesis protein [Desulfallas thermosapovorans]|uniref:FlaA1/EpsC-like NDP-sugar epimerase n=1 Tax=Desulfallas thermosapovorans DSM 6562 TaxID=1121431 RepID=A0A5S4ZW54_9FIRM|nr:nucleoside-diphosphate sugar epimerase/dehydratase [Desulfallas thermosapovorans]TYO96446.1 FlaA1/EpsC-like NDP-sugar epimerase [Desulfallas thermosapovorans DSM 6562]